MIHNYFRPIHFVARPSEFAKSSRSHALNIYVWRSLDDVLDTLCQVIPGFRHDLTSEEVRDLARTDWDDFYASRLSLDEFAALWIVKATWDPMLQYPNPEFDMYTIAGGLNYAGRLLAMDERLTSTNLDYRFIGVESLPDKEVIRQIFEPEAFQLRDEILNRLVFKP